MQHQNPELQVHIRETENVRIIQVEGDLSIRSNQSLRAAFLAGLHPGARAVVDASGVTSVDLSSLQLLCSAHRTYVLNGAALEFAGRSEVLDRTARTAGYDASHSVCPHRRDCECLWICPQAPRNLSQEPRA